MKRKTTKNGSTIWKYLVDYFPLIGPWMVWRVGNG
jgi:hypothetical protein